MLPPLPETAGDTLAAVEGALADGGRRMRRCSCWPRTGPTSAGRAQPDPVGSGPGAGGDAGGEGTPEVSEFAPPSSGSACAASARGARPDRRRPGHRHRFPGLWPLLTDELALEVLGGPQDRRRYPPATNASRGDRRPAGRGRGDPAAVAAAAPWWRRWCSRPTTPRRRGPGGGREGTVRHVNQATEHHQGSTPARRGRRRSASTPRSTGSPGSSPPGRHSTLELPIHGPGLAGQPRRGPAADRRDRTRGPGRRSGHRAGQLLLAIDPPQLPPRSSSTCT